MKSVSSKFFYCICIFVFFFHSGFAQKSKDKPASKYDFQGPFCNGLARVKQKLKWGFIDTTGGVVVPLKYNEVTNFSDGISKVRIGQKWGLIDTKGTVIIKPTFDAIFDFVDGKAKVMLDGQEYYMNKQGVRVDK